MSNKLTSLNALLRDPNAWFFELDALREPITDRNFIPHLANFCNCDCIEKTTRYIPVGTRTVHGCFTEADYAHPSECYRRFYIAHEGEFIPVDGYDRLIVVSSLDLKELYVAHGGRRRQKLVNFTDLVRIIAYLGETGVMKL